jgi:hypothetical protein
VTLILLALLGCSGDDTEGEPVISDEVLERARNARSQRTKRGAATSTSKRRRDRWARLASAVRALEGGDVSEEIDGLLDAREDRREGDDLRIARALSSVERGFVLECAGGQVDRAFVDFQADQAAVLQQDRDDLERILELSGDQGRELIWSIAHPERTFAAGRREATLEDPASLGADQSAAMVRLRLDLEVATLDARELVEGFEAAVLALDPGKPSSVRLSLEELRGLDQALLLNQGQRYLMLQQACTELSPQLWLELVAEGHVALALQAYPAPDAVEESTQHSLDGEAPSLARMKRGRSSQDPREN